MPHTPDEPVPPPTGRRRVRDSIHPRRGLPPVHVRDAVQRELERERRRQADADAAEGVPR